MLENQLWPEEMHFVQAPTIYNIFSDECKHEYLCQLAFLSD